MTRESWSPREENIDEYPQASMSISISSRYEDTCLSSILLNNLAIHDLPAPTHSDKPQTNEIQTTFANELWTRIRYEFPELRIYRVWDTPIGPHPLGMFEVDILTPAQFGAFVAWLVINRGPLSALVHPNTDDHMVSA